MPRNKLKRYTGAEVAQPKSIAEQLLADTKLGNLLYGKQKTYKDGNNQERKDASFKESANGQLVQRAGETAKDVGGLVATGLAFGNPLTASTYMAPVITGSQAYWIGYGINDGAQRIDNIGEGVKNFVEDPSWQNAGAVVNEVPMLALDVAGALPVARTVATTAKQVVPTVKNATSKAANYLKKQYASHGGAKIKYKWVKDIGDGGLRWQYVNRMDIDNAYNSLVSRGIIDNNTDALVGSTLGDTSNLKIIIDDNTANIIKSLDDYYWRYPAKWYDADPSIRWFLNETGNKSPEQISEFINLHLNPTSPRYNSMKTALREFGIDDSFLRPYKSQIGRKAIVEHSRAVEDALGFVKKGHVVKEATTPSGGYIFKYQSPKYKIDPNRPLSGSMLDEDVITMGWIKPGNRTLTSDGTFSVGQTAAHEGAHANLGYNSQPKWLTNTSDWDRITEQEKFRRLVEATPDSPKYHFSYSSVPESSKKLLTPTKSVNDHASELAEGFSDLWATKYGMHDLGISSAALDPVKKYNYLDLFRYKMTPTGMTDRFIRQRGGWWKGWRQQLDALNEVYKNGGKL